MSKLPAIRSQKLRDLKQKTKEVHAKLCKCTDYTSIIGNLLDKAIREDITGPLPTQVHVNPSLLSTRPVNLTAGASAFANAISLRLVKIKSKFLDFCCSHISRRDCSNQSRFSAWTKTVHEKIVRQVW